MSLALDSKASRLEVEQAMARPMAPIGDVHALAEENGVLIHRVDQLERTIEFLKTELTKKADQTAVEQELRSKASSSELASALQSKADAAAVEEQMQGKASRSAVAAALQKRARQADMDVALGGKADVETVNESLALKADHTTVTTALASKVSQAELNEITQALEQRHTSDTQRVEARNIEAAQAIGKTIAALQSDLNAFIRETGVKMSHLEDAQAKTATKEDLAREISTRVTPNDAQAMVVAGVAPKADMAAVEGLESRFHSTMQDYMVASEVVDLLGQRATVSEVNQIRSRQDVLVRSTQELSSGVSTISTKIAEAIGDEFLRDKADSSAVIAMLEAKPDASAVQEQIMQLSRQIESKAALTDLSRSIADQRSVNDCIYGELSVGRWIWNSGKTKSGGIVPWNVQTVCTQPDNFVWKKNTTSITTVSPGLYEVVFGFFTKKKPSIQLLLNGEPCLSAVNSASQLLHHSSSRLANVQHPAGNVTGLTLIDFLALPAKAKLSISYSGETAAEGFLSLRKL